MYVTHTSSFARNVDVSIIQADGQIKVWNASFTLPGSFNVERGREYIEAQITQTLETVDFAGPDLSKITLDRDELRKLLEPIYHSSKGDYNKWMHGQPNKADRLTLAEGQAKLAALFNSL